MIVIYFDLGQEIVAIQANLNDPFEVAIKQYVQKTEHDINSIYFLVNGNKIDPKKTIESQISRLDKDKKEVKVLAYLKEDDKESETKIIFGELKIIICPICKKPCKIKFVGHKIYLYCVNGHERDNIKLAEFKNTQKINFSEIKCDMCKIRNKGNTTQNSFYKCLVCNKNLCPLCQQNHEHKPKIVDYEEKFYYCSLHPGKSLAKFCKSCNVDICLFCQKNHKNHVIIDYELPDIDKIKKRLYEIETNNKLFKEDVQKNYIDRFNKMIKDIDLYYKIKKNILDTFEAYENKNNSETFHNLNEIVSDDQIFQKINVINKNNDLYSKTLDIFDLYNNMNLAQKEIDNFSKSQYIPNINKKNENIYDISLNIENIEILLNQMKKSICIIYTDKNKVGTGFFSQLVINDKIIPILIANTKIFNSDIAHKEINVEFNDGRQKCIKNISLENRRKFINKEFNLAIIQIMKITDKINNFIELDNYISNFELDEKETANKLLTKYLDEDIYILYFQQNNELKASFGNIKNVSKNNIKQNSIESFIPIISQKNNKLIDICINNSKSDDYFNDIQILKKTLIEFKKSMINYMKGNAPKVSIEKKLNEMNMVYTLKNGTGRVKLFGAKFIQNNKNNCYLIIDGQQKELCEEFELDENQKLKDKLEIRLIIEKPITNFSGLFYDCSLLIYLSGLSSYDFKVVTDMSYMFYGCSSLVSLSEAIKLNKNNSTNMNLLFNINSPLDITKWDTRNVHDMSFLFNGCSALKSLPDISKWNTLNVKKMNYLFADCGKILTLPDISKWNTKNVVNMSFMFKNCFSLISLPDLSKWDTSKVIDISYMFSLCSVLNSLPDISTWNTTEIKNFSYLFHECKALTSLTDISKWNVKNAINMSYMFSDCESMKSLPDISKWNLDKVTNMSYIFKNCHSLKVLPDISKWDMKNINNLSNMFSYCDSLISLPDISQWNISNANDISYMFSDCKLLKSLPDISKWNVQNIEDMSYLLYNCKSLESIPDFSKWKVNSKAKKENIFLGCKEKIIPKKSQSSNCFIF